MSVPIFISEEQAQGFNVSKIHACSWNLSPTRDLALPERAHSIRRQLKASWFPGHLHLSVHLIKQGKRSHLQFSNTSAWDCSPDVIFHRITMVEVWRDLWRHPLQHPVQTGPPRTGCPGPCADVEDLQQKRLKNLGIGNRNRKSCIWYKSEKLQGSTISAPYTCRRILLSQMMVWNWSKQPQHKP